MPISIVLIILGILMICAATYLTMPAPIKQVCMFFGVACLIIGVVLLLWGLLSGAGSFKLALVLLGLG